LFIQRSHYNFTLILLTIVKRVVVVAPFWSPLGELPPMGSSKEIKQPYEALAVTRRRALPKGAPSKKALNKG